VEFNIRQDWKQAFEAVIPPRKFVEKKRKRHKVAVDQAAAGGAEMEEEAEGEDRDEDEDDQLEGQARESQHGADHDPIGSDGETTFHAT
jgi:hypothetical protein